MTDQLTPNVWPLLDSTEAARELDTTVVGLEWFRQYRGLKAVEGPTGTLRYSRSDLERAKRAHPTYTDDPLREARGMLHGAILGLLIAASVLGLILWVKS